MYWEVTQELELAFIFLAVFQLKHYLADFPLQSAYMLRKGWRTRWVAPLLSHCAVHAFFTVIIACVFLALTGKGEEDGSATLPLLLGAIDFVTHFVMDRIKASDKLLGRWGVANPKFWWALGFDQMVHHLVGLYIVWRLMNF